MRTAMATALGACLLMAVVGGGCAPKGAGTPGQPSSSPSNLYGLPPAASPLATLKFQPLSGTWQVTGKLATDKIKPFPVVLEFQPNGLISVNGNLVSDEQLKAEPWTRDYIGISTLLGQEKLNVIFHLGGQYTLTMSAPGQMEGVALVNGNLIAAVRVLWQNESTVPPP